ncbi:MAG: hypothetical protein GX937_15865 [Lentisphaerae bacterium]|nr:hypothetical protein [Lentisphaerota bacterium]
MAPTPAVRPAGQNAALVSAAKNAGNGAIEDDENASDPTWNRIHGRQQRPRRPKRNGDRELVKATKKKNSQNHLQNMVKARSVVVESEI